MGSAGPKASILILEQGSSVGPGSREEQRPFSPDESADRAEAPKPRGPTLTANWQQAAWAGILHSGLAVGHSNQKTRELVAPLWLAGQVSMLGQWVDLRCLQSVLGLLQAPLESMVLVGIRQDLVPHAPKHVGCGLCC